MSGPVGFTATFTPTAFREALRKLSGVIDAGKTALPVTKGVLIQAGSGLTMSATNFDAAIKLVVPCDLQGDGAVVLPLKRLADIAANIPQSGMSESLVKIAVSDLTAKITSGRAKFEVSGMDADEFPLWDPIPGVVYDVKVKAWLDTLNRIAVHAAPLSHDKARPALTSVCCEDGIVAAADTSGLGMMTSENIGGPYLLHGASIPALTRLFDKMGEQAQVRITASEARMSVASDDAEIQIRLVEGPYPPFRALLAQKPTHTVTCGRETLRAAVARVAFAANVTGRVQFTFADDLTLCASGDGASAQDVLAIDRQGDPITIAVNGNLMLLGLDTFRGERVVLTMESPTRAIFMRDPDLSVSDSPLVLTMPLRV